MAAFAVVLAVFLVGTVAGVTMLGWWRHPYLWPLALPLLWLVVLGYALDLALRLAGDR